MLATCDSRKATGAETIASGEDQALEIGKVSSNQVQRLIANGHPLESEFFQGRISSAEGHNPGASKSTPVTGQEIEVAESRLAFQSDRLDFGESLGESLRRHCIAVANEDAPPAFCFDVEPGFANQRHIVPILVCGDELQHILQHVLQEIGGRFFSSSHAPLCHGRNRRTQGALSDGDPNFSLCCL